jgi:uncharacterized protein YndB with AHSA1/START domain
MNDLAAYVPGPAGGARIEPHGEKRTLILVRQLRHPPEKVWQAITQPEHVREWAPFDVDGDLARVGATVHLTWLGTGHVSETTVTQSDPPRVLAYNDIRWELEPMAGGTHLTLWHSIARRYVTWGAAGWHISLDVLDRLLAGNPIARVAGPNAMHFPGFQRLVAEYAREFGVEPHGQPAMPSRKTL